MINSRNLIYTNILDLTDISLTIYKKSALFCRIRYVTLFYKYIIKNRLAQYN